VTPPGRRHGPSIGRHAPAAAAVLLAAAIVPGCAEISRPPPPPPPTGLLLGQEAMDPSPVRAVAEAAAAAFADRGSGLAGRPAAMAQAAAQLEFLASDLPRDPRYGRLAEGVSNDLALARQEVRDVLGIAQAAAPAVVTQALLAAARALRAGDRAAAAAALPAPTFEPGGAGSVARLGEAGPMPQAGIATQYAAQAVARADALGLAGTPRFSETSFGFGAATTDYGARPGAGY
jgi:hypothetical protein